MFAIGVTAVFNALLALINIGSTVAFNAILSILAAGLLSWMEPEYVEFFWKSAKGPYLIATAVLLQVIGGIWVWRILKTGTGTWVLTGASTFTGTTSIQNGTLSVSSINSVVDSRRVSIRENSANLSLEPSNALRVKGTAPI